MRSAAKPLGLVVVREHGDDTNSLRATIEGGTREGAEGEGREGGRTPPSPEPEPVDASFEERDEIRTAATTPPQDDAPSIPPSSILAVDPVVDSLRADLETTRESVAAFARTAERVAGASNATTPRRRLRVAISSTKARALSTRNSAISATPSTISTTTNGVDSRIASRLRFVV